MKRITSYYTTKVLICQVKFFYGGEGIRTPDPRLAKPMLSQLSYTPSGKLSGPKWDRTTDLPVISRVLCQLSYEPIDIIML